MNSSPHPYRLKMSYRDLFFMTNGKVPGFGLNIAQFAAEKMFSVGRRHVQTPH